VVMAAKKSSPLRKRAPRELKGDWRKYLVIALIMVFMIGMTSGVYVANHSMMSELEQAYEKYSREDGHFELSKEAGNDFLKAVSSGEMADLRQWMYDKASEEAEDEIKEKVDEVVEEKVREELYEQALAQLQAAAAAAGTSGAKLEDAADAIVDDYIDDALKEAFESEEYEEALEEARQEAEEEIEEAVDGEYEKLEEKYGLDEERAEYSADIYELYYKETDEDYDCDGTADGTVRIYKLRDDVDKICLMYGSFPEGEDEVLLDRRHAENVGLEVGGKVAIGGKEYTISGLGAFSDYATLHKKNTDIMFDALTFDVCALTEEGFENVDARTHYCYAWRYDEPTEGDIDAKDRADALIKVLAAEAAVNEADIEDCVPAYLSQAINFAPDDMGSDLAMIEVMLVILMAVIAFVFALTTESTIEKEAPVIGTLRAMGYTRGELLRHYLTMPMTVTLIAAVIGNIVGYTIFQKICVYAYYNSYSLPTYETLFTPAALIKTTIIPLVIMLAVNLIVLARRLKLSPLKFLRRDLKKAKSKKAMRLPRWSFLSRFRLRVFFQNIGNYLVLFAGLVFVATLLAMCIGLPATLENYKAHVTEMMFADYQTVLASNEDEDGEEITTEAEGAEKFAMCSLEYYNSSGFDESVSVYGVEDGSAYVNIGETGEGEAYVSSALAEKYGFKEGSSFTLNDKYTGAEYDISVKGVFSYDGAIAVFMDIDSYCAMFDEEDGYFSGYLSHEEITDIDEDCVATVITADGLLSVANQLDHSMGFMMDVFSYVCAVIAGALIYLLTKVIIEKNENSISMLKILGFTNGEASKVYVRTTTVVVAVSALAAVALGNFVMEFAWKAMMMGMNGYFRFEAPFAGSVKMYVMILAAYLVVTLIDLRRIRRIPMAAALKNIE